MEGHPADVKILRVEQSALQADYFGQILDS